MRVFLPLTVVGLLAVFLYAEYATEPTCAVWTYRTRPGEEASRVYICKIETRAGVGRVYHLYVDGLEIPNPKAKGEEDAKIPVLTHLPISEAAFKESVLEKVKDDAPMPPYQAGYARWEKDFEQKRAGVFEIPIRQCIDAISAAMK